MVTLRHLKIFVTVCDCGSMTQAAGRLYLAQPAVSLAIRELEEAYGVRLFDRIARKLYLTPGGRRLEEYARHITALFDEMEREIKDGDGKGGMRIGASITIGTYLMPGLVRRFQAAYPSISVRVAVCNSGDIEGYVLRNEVDFAMIEGVIHADQLVCRNFMEDELVFVGAPGNPWGNTATAQELARLPLLLRERGSGARELLESALLTHGVRVAPIWESVSNEALLQAVQAGLGITALSQRLVWQRLEEGSLARVTVPDLDLHRAFSFIYHKDKYLTAAMKEFMGLIDEAQPDSPLLNNESAKR